MAIYTYPILVQLPIVALSPAVSIPLPYNVEAEMIVGFLQALTSGTYSVDVLSGRGSLLGTVSFSAAGTQTVIPSDRPQVSDRIDFNVTGIGVGASGAYVAVWVTSGTRKN